MLNNHSSNGSVFKVGKLKSILHTGLMMLSFLLAPSLIFAQTIFQNIKWQDGLSAKQVRSLYKDSDGFLWIATTNGLNRYDGAVVKQYRAPAGEKSMLINALQPLEGDKKLLLGLNAGVAIFDKRTSTFSKDNRFAALDESVILRIETGPGGSLWIATLNNIHIFEKGKLTLLSDQIPEASVLGKKGYIISTMVHDTVRRGFWITGSAPYFVDYQNKKVYSYEYNPLKLEVLRHKVNALALDLENNVWFGCDDDPSLNFWNAKTNKLDTYRTLDGKEINEGCNYLFVDVKGRLWISTWLFAAYIKEPGKPIKKINYSQNQAYTIAYGHFRHAIEDEDGNVWLGTINGVSKSQENYPLTAIYQLPNFKFRLETGFSHANHISIDGSTIVASKEDGIIFYNTVDRTFRHYAVSKTDFNKNRFMMSARGKDTWWFIGMDGIYLLKDGSDALKKLDYKFAPGTDYANFVLIDHRGKIWFEILNDAIYCHDSKTGKTLRFDGKDEQYGLFKFEDCSNFLQLNDGSHDILFSRVGKGMLRFDYKKEHFTVTNTPGIGNSYVSGMAEDGHGAVWAAVSGRGIIKLDKMGNAVDSVNTTNGLFYDYIGSIAFDAKGAVWGSSREGLMFFNPNSRAVTKVDIDLDKTLQDYFNYVTFSNGKVYAVMLDNIVVIDPLRFAGIPVKKPPFITSVQVVGKERLSSQRNGLLELEANDDFITFQYASLNHRDIPSLQYSYQLEGIDKNWVNAGRAITVSYTNLVPGDYTFKVRSTDQFGIWMKKPRVLQVHIKPNWWQTWWFIAFCTLLCFVALFFAYQAYIKRKQKKRYDKTIDYFANSVYGENSVTEICWDIARNCIAQMRFEDCVVYLLDEPRNLLVQQAAYGPKNPRGFEIINPIEIELGRGVVGTAAKTGKSLIVGDTSKDDRYIVDDQARGSEIAVPILHEGKVIGVIDSEHTKKHFFDEKHAKTLSTVAAISANKIAEAQAKSQAREQELIVLEIQKMLAESQLMALRAQMNPHFVFNCLNSIQECIVTKKYAEASKYLNKFSKLFRLVLGNSSKKLVSLEEERQVLELYLELELMRFDQSFTYEIIVDPRLDENQISLPSMLLQPYVENALWHGLMAKDGPRALRIEFQMINEDAFLCQIDDNGIGRTESFEIKAQNGKPKTHKSMGLAISKDRINLLSMHGNHASVRIIDKYDPQGTAAGTLVEVELSTYLRTP